MMRYLHSCQVETYSVLEPPESGCQRFIGDGSNMEGFFKRMVCHNSKNFDSVVVKQKWTIS